MPIFRGRQEEVKVLKSFDFGSHIYPCLEIIKEIDRVQGKTAKKKKTFESVYIPLINSINSVKVFVDLPVHLQRLRAMQKPVLNFLTKVIINREVRTNYLKKLVPLSDKIIPVISTFSQVTGEKASIKIQEEELRTDFSTLAFRTFFNTFHNDYEQIREVAKANDYIIMDCESMEIDLDDGDILDIIDLLRSINCSVILHRDQVPVSLKLSRLTNDKKIDIINNELLEKFDSVIPGSSFSDYVGIKKDGITTGGIISPGFIYYDAVLNTFYGYRFKHGSHEKGKAKPLLEEFEKTIVPSVINSNATKRMTADINDYLGSENVGWRILKNIELGIEPGKSAPKFKRISMEHYLHCVKKKIITGDIL
jgi:hypothetical protein